MTIPKKTPNKNIPINVADKRRLVGVSLSGPNRYISGSVQVVYARTMDIDGFIFDIVETEYVTEQDFEKVKWGNPDCLKALFGLAIQSAMCPVNEVLRLLELRK